MNNFQKSAQVGVSIPMPKQAGLCNCAVCKHDTNFKCLAQGCPCCITIETNFRDGIQIRTHHNKIIGAEVRD